MIRNTVIAAAAVMMFAVVPAQAGVVYGGAPAIEDGGYKQDVSHWVQKCKIVRVKSYYGWKNVKKCRKVFLKHYNSY
jgi:hypothetical protein